MRSADSDQHVDFALGPRGGDRRRQITGRDHLDAGAGAPNFIDQLFMPRAIKNRDAQILDVNLLRFSERLEIVAGRSVNIDHAASRRSARHLVHVSVGASQDSPALGQRHARQRVGPAGRADDWTFDRVERDVDFRARAGADYFALVEEFGVALFALADYYLAVHRDRIQRLAHRVARR